VSSINSLNNIKILLGEFNAKVWREDIFRQTIRHESLSEINNDNGVRIVKFATSKKLATKSTCSHIIAFINLLRHLLMERLIQKIYHILRDRTQHSSVLDIRSFKIDELATNSKNENIRDLYKGINEFNRGYQCRSNLVKDENGDLLVISTTI
jgi:hypothetical protein